MASSVGKRILNPPPVNTAGRRPLPERSPYLELMRGAIQAVVEGGPNAFYYHASFDDGNPYLQTLNVARELGMNISNAQDAAQATLDPRMRVIHQESHV